MLSGDFERRLRRLNRNLRVYCGNNDLKPAGVFMVTPIGEAVEICGIDKNYVPEYTQWNEDGSIKKGGWRRALRILIQKGLICRKYSEKVFQTHLEYKIKTKKERQNDSLIRKLQSFGTQLIERGTY